MSGAATSHDQIGAGARQSNASRLRALALVTEGRLFELDHEIQAGAPHFKRIQPPYLMSLWSRAENVIRVLRRQRVTNDPGVNLEHVHMTFHVGTHVDALGHFTIGERMYSGHSATEVVGDLGLRRLGVEHVPALITRGVCLDVSDLDGDQPLQAGRVVGKDDLQHVLQRDGLSVEPGDVALIRTGWEQFYASEPERYAGAGPGIDLEAARWLTSRGVIAIGADNMAVEVLPGTDPAVSMPVHQHCLVEEGVYLIENLRLSDLCAAQCKLFCFLMLGPKFKGATGAPVRPVALI